jgi:hypothetical protein
MKIDKSAILKAFKADLKNADQLQKEWLAKRDMWLNESYGNPYGNEVDNKSKIVSKDIKKQIEWLIPSAADPFLSTSDVIKCTPITAEDTLSARQNELLLNTQFCRKFSRFNFINKAIRVLATEGTLVIQTGWDYEDKEVEEEVEIAVVDKYGNTIIRKEIQKVTKVIKNQPTAIVCRNEDIFIDPTCMDDMDKCQFIIHRYESDLSTLKADGRYKNLDKIDTNSGGYDPDFDAQDKTEFKFEDKARKKVLVYEYWGNYDVNNDGITEQIVCAWVGDTIIRLEDNPYPDKKPPFIVVPFSSIPFQMYGEALAENIGDNQKVKTAITRGIIDNMAKSNNGQIGIRLGALDLANRKKFLQGKNFEFKGTPADFWQGSFNQIPGSVFDMLQLMNNEIESQTGVNAFSKGLTGNSLGSSATAARGMLDATALRRLHLVRNIAENLVKPLMRKWMAYNSEFLEEEEVVRVTNEEYVPVRRDDLEGKIDIDITISTYEEANARSQELGFMLQTLGNSIPFELTQLILSEIVKLGRMPELEKALREYKPQPDPIQEQIKQLEIQKLQLENSKLLAEIQDLSARAGENEVDMKLKEYKAQVEAAKARALHSKADLDDLAMLMKDEGYDEYLEEQRFARDRMAKIEDDERQRVHDRAVIAAQIAAKDRQIGLPSKR